NVRFCDSTRHPDAACVLLMKVDCLSCQRTASARFPGLRSAQRLHDGVAIRTSGMHLRLPRIASRRDPPGRSLIDEDATTKVGKFPMQRMMRRRNVKASVLHQYDESLTRDEFVRYEDVADPKIERPTDVIVRIGGAGVCRTDLHVVEGIWRSKVDIALPYIMGHENAGWVEAAGSAVESVK